MIKLDDITFQILNRRLKEFFGNTEDLANFRLIFSEDELEKRLTKYSDSGIELLHHEIRILPKYKQWIHNKYVLERLVVVPQIKENDLTELLSYEPLWVFETKSGEFQMPTWDAMAFLVEHVYKQMESPNAYTKYPEGNPEEMILKDKMRIEELQKDLFGNETDVTDALAYREGIVVPGPTQIKEG